MKKTEKCFLAILAIAFALTLTGCRSDTEPAPDNELLILCGSSFVNPARQLFDEFEKATGIKTVITVAGSEDFLPLIKTGEKGDVVITHDPYLDYVADADALAVHAQVGYVAPVLAVAKGNPKGLTKIEDLAKPGIKVAVSNPEYSTCGEMVFALLDKKQITEDVMKNVETRLTKGHSTLGTWLKVGQVDAAIMWNGVANTFADSLEIVPTPYEYDNDICVHVIGLNYSKNPDAVKQLIEFTKKHGPGIFAENGYVK